MRDPVAERFGENLRRLRGGADLSQEELAQRAGLHRTEIGMLERGIRLARIDTLVKLCGSLDVDAGKLLEGITWQVGVSIAGHFSLGDSTQDRHAETNSLDANGEPVGNR